VDLMMGLGSGLGIKNEGLSVDLMMGLGLGD
jgi:hypothetical protein